MYWLPSLHSGFVGWRYQSRRSRQKRLAKDNIMTLWRIQRLFWHPAEAAADSKGAGGFASRPLYCLTRYLMPVAAQYLQVKSGPTAGSVPALKVPLVHQIRRSVLIHHQLQHNNSDEIKSIFVSFSPVTFIALQCVSVELVLKCLSFFIVCECPDWQSLNIATILSALDGYL
jgi:hypothetical protein